MQVQIQTKTLRLVEGDITDLAVDAIVNAANHHLLLGSGVAGAIRSKGGPTIQQECDQIGGCPVGGAVITGGGTLPARHVIHAVGPHGGDPGADNLLASATRTSLTVAEENNLASIAFPAISTGVFGYPREKCARIMLETARQYLETSTGSLNEIVFCLWGQDTLSLFEAELTRQANLS